MRRHPGYFFILICLNLLSACGQNTEAEPTPLPPDLQATAEVYFASDDLHSAVQVWEQALEEDPGDLEAHYRLALILLLDDPDSATSHLDRIGSAPEYADQVSRLRAALRQAAVINDQAYYLTIIGQALSSIGEWQLAQTALERAVEVNPDYAEAWAYLGEARLQNKEENALEALQTAHALKPDSFAANLFLSMYYRRTGQALAAVEYLETAIQSDPENKDLQADLAQTLVEAGGASKGFQILEELAAESPQEAESWLRLARLSIYNNLQVRQTGLPAAREALLLAPDQPEAALLLGRAYLLLGDTLMAERFLSQALAADPDSGEAHYYLGILYLNEGDGSLAKDHLHSAASLAAASGNQVLADQVADLIEEYFGE
ncbi:MAG: tetratricopeptide repeat protein [Anaerolineales bacterium]